MAIFKALLPLLLALPLDAQDHTAPPKQKLTLSLECWKLGEWKTTNAQTVFNHGDRLRFKFRSSTPGYLYILAQASSGTTSWLFPVTGTQSDRLTAAREVTIPNADGYFVIGGPPGFDTLFWIMRSSPMTLPAVEPTKLEIPSTLISRCPEEETPSQVACLDKNAGPQKLTNTSKLQSALGLSDSLTARDLTFETKTRATEISADSDDSNGIVYQVRIAHK
jgi:hypothetical protein